ncbi:MAG: sugar ABC transporter permease [Clostridiales bacterium]|jgi:multiple sugar transport system permease protein|nr:sugar ABC transporter permease [Clostridiales bacterium]
MKTAEKKSFSQWMRSIRGQQILVTVVFMVIPIALLITFTYLPLFKMAQFSFYNMKYIGTRTYIGFQNYIDVFTRDDIFQALKLSLFYLVAAIVQMALALMLAAIVTSGLRGTAFFKGAVFFPYLVCGIAVGFIFKFFFTHGFVLDTLLTHIGFQLNSLPYWLKDTSVNNSMLAATSVWRYMGQNMVLFIGAMMSVDNDVYEAAVIDGANAWQKFWSITMPGIKTMVVLNLILSISGSISAFEPPYVITNGAFGTGTYFVIMDRIAHVNQKVGLASAMAVVLMFIIAFVTILQKLASHFLLDEDETGRTFHERRIAKKRSQSAQ